MSSSVSSLKRDLYDVTNFHFVAVTGHQRRETLETRLFSASSSVSSLKRDLYDVTNFHFVAVTGHQRRETLETRLFSVSSSVSSLKGDLYDVTNCHFVAVTGRQRRETLETRLFSVSSFVSSLKRDLYDVTNLRSDYAVTDHRLNPKNTRTNQVQFSNHWVLSYCFFRCLSGRIINTRAYPSMLEYSKERGSCGGPQS